MNHPAKLGKYQITGVLGEGAMGVVYRGFDPDIRRVVALKTIRHQAGHSAQAVAQSAARFRNEAQAAGRLLHPGIVGVYDFGDDGNVAYIAMEYVEGHTLSPYLTQKVPFTVTDIASIGVQLAEALAHAHEHGVWHRDVKPSNVIMTKSGRVKIADFGIARTDTSGLTMAGSVLGTPMYMAPEQFLGNPFDHRVDVYGIGVVLYQVVAGRPPFVGPTESLMYKVVNEVPQPASSVEGGAGHTLFDGAIAKALAKDPAQRYASASALRDALADALTTGSGLAVPAAVAREAVHALPMASDYAPTERILRPAVAAAASPADPPSSGGIAPAHWDPGALARAEAALARHVGPMAGVMVRRAARECHDVTALYVRLGEQITQPAAREAFLGLITGSGARTGGSRGAAAGAVPAPGQPATSTGSPVSDALLEQAQKLLAGHVGPIAKVLVKRAAQRTRQREALFALLIENLPEAVRARALADLNRLPQR